MLATDQILFELHMYQEHNLRKYSLLKCLLDSFPFCQQK